MELFKRESGFTVGDPNDYLFVDNDGNKIDFLDSLIEDRLILGDVALNRDILTTLLPILETWMKTGRLPENIKATTIRGCCCCKLDLDSCGNCQTNIKRNNGIFVFDDMRENEDSLCFKEEEGS